MKFYSKKQTPQVFPFPWTIYSSREFVLKHNQEKKNSGRHCEGKSFHVKRHHKEGLCSARVTG